MLRHLFSTRPRIEVEDHVWLDSLQRDAGVGRALAEASAHRGACLLVRDQASLEAMLAANEALSPVPARSGFEYDAAVERLRKPGMLMVALAKDAANRPLRAKPESASTPPPAPAFHVRLRSTQRREDARLLEALGRGWIERVVFHSALDDPLLRDLVRDIGPLLKGMGMRADEPVSGVAVTRAVLKAQRD